ncbi:dicarboxylate/amino acid:cation symporter [Pseudomonas sp. F1_0610]|uniref:dicarboxylate/amino acid:cation symporter n=1 Tax=Pseudomonas sp. F1_0610 TaxID=3114284 RepID=UPI0039C0FD11
MKKIWSWYLQKSFMTKMTAGFVLGIIAGLILGPQSEMFGPLGELFLKLLKMVVLPLILLSLIVAVNHSNPKELGRIGAKIFPFYIIATGISVCVGIMLAKLTNPGVGLTLPTDVEVVAPEKPSFLSILMNMVPSNIFEAFVAGDVLSVVFVAVVVGLSFLYLRHSGNEEQQAMGELLLKVTNAGNEATMKLLNGILQYAPIGIFGITAQTIGHQGVDTLIVLGKFVGTSYLGVILLLTVVFPIFLKLAGVRVIKFYRDIKEAVFTSFVTCSSLGTLPLTIKCAEKAGINERVAKLTLPIGATVNMNGTALRFGVAVVFAAEIMGITLSVPELATIVIIGTMAAVGTAGVPGAGLIGMSIVFTQAGLPIEIVALTAGVNVLLDMAFTCGNVTGDLVGAKVVDQSERRAERKAAALAAQRGDATVSQASTTE